MYVKKRKKFLGVGYECYSITGLFTFYIAESV